MQVSATAVFFVRILEPSERQAARGNSRQPGAKVQRDHCRSPYGHKDPPAHNTASLQLRRCRAPRELRLSSMATPIAKVGWQFRQSHTEQGGWFVGFCSQPPLPQMALLYVRAEQKRESYAELSSSFGWHSFFGPSRDLRCSGRRCWLPWRGQS